MDIRYYFTPVNFSRIQESNSVNTKITLGSIIEQNNLALSSENIDRFEIALIGIPDETNTLNKGTKAAPDKIRTYLYRLTGVNSKLKIIDLGNLKKGTGKNDLYYALRDVIDYLHHANIISVLIGGGQDAGLGVTRAFKFNRHFQMSCIDSGIDMKSGRETYNSFNYLTRVLKDSPDLFNINFIGYQTYFVPEKVLDKAKQKDFSCLRLGKIREDITQVEPLIRDSHFVSFDISAVRLQDAPGYFDGSPNGIYSEEACQLSRYAGISSKTSVFGIFEVNPKLDRNNQTSKLAAQIVWYFIEGYGFRDSSEPVSGNPEFMEYNIELEDMNIPLVFLKHKSTNRWWMQIEGLDKNKVLIACRETDYKMACDTEIPEKWLTFVRKIDRMSK